MVCLERHSVGAFIAVNIYLICISGSGLGYCPKMKYISDFNLTRFTGHWYEIERSFYLMELISSCVSVDLIENSKGQLEVSIYSKSRWSGIFSISEGTATASKKDPSVLIYKVNSKLPRIVSRFLPGAGSYQVLGTDYDYYAVLYSCTNFGVMHFDLVWIWSRHKEIDAETRAKIYNMLAINHIDSERLILPQNQNCTDY